jgi:flagellar hook protein FlgE
MGFGSLYSAISGLRGNLFSMNIVGNNIANANTVGYKSDRVTFREALVQTLRGASAPRGNLGGQNPMQLGLGMEVASVDADMKQGALQDTGLVTDMAIDGDGYFVLAKGKDMFYSRAGNFVFDRDGNLTNRGSGEIVQGWLADDTGMIPTGAPLQNINLPFDRAIPGKATTEIKLSANLDASASNSTASLGSAGTTGIGSVVGTATNGAGGSYAVTIGGANATSSTALGANLSLPGTLTGAEKLSALGVTNVADFTVSVDGKAAVPVPGLTTDSTVNDVVNAINDLGIGVTAKIDNGEVRLTRDFHGDGAVYKVTTSVGAAGNISRQLFGAGVGSAFNANSGAASTLTASSVFTPTGSPAQGSTSLDITYDPLSGLATGLSGLGGGGVTIGAGTTGLQAGTATIDTKPTSHLTSVLVYDSLGDPHTLNLTFTRSATLNQWTWKAGLNNGETISGGGSGTVQFNPDGSLQSWSYDAGAQGLTLNPASGANLMSIDLKTGTANGFDGLTQFVSPLTARASSQNGYATGTLSSISIDNAGVISGHFSNGVLQDLGQLVLARFNNPDGLSRVSGSLYQTTTNSGDGIVGAAGVTVPGTITSGALEMSNVDLSEEFVRMIVAQRGFQANARVITTGDEIMTDLINLKR